MSKPAPADSVQVTHTALSTAPRAREDPSAREVHTAMPFRMLGLTWKGAEPDRVEVRLLAPGGWGAWTELEPAETGPRAAGSEPLWTGPASTVRVRAQRGGADVTGTLQLVTLDPSAARVPPPPPPRPPGLTPSGRPPVVTRAQWGADESLMKWPPQYTRSTRAVTVHHTAGTNDYNCAQSADIVRGIYHYHAVELRWGDIGYHALVDKCGTIFEGRAGGLARNVIGGHARGFNHSTFGVAMMGNYDAATPSPRMVNSVAALAGWKLRLNGVPAQGRTTLISAGGEGSRFPAGTPVHLPTIFGHRDVGLTSCPGQKGYDQLGAIRHRAALPG